MRARPSGQSQIRQSARSLAGAQTLYGGPWWYSQFKTLLLYSQHRTTQDPKHSASR